MDTPKRRGQGTAHPPVPCPGCGYWEEAERGRGRGLSCPHEHRALPQVGVVGGRTPAHFPPKAHQDMDLRGRVMPGLMWDPEGRSLAVGGGGGALPRPLPRPQETPPSSVPSRSRGSGGVTSLTRAYICVRVRVLGGKG